MRRAFVADRHRPPAADLLRSLGLFPRIRAEAPQVTQARVSRHLALCAADDSHLVLVAEASGGAIAGYGAVHWLPYLILAGAEGYVSELCVRDTFHGQELGRQLLDIIKAEARNRDCARLMLLNMCQCETYQRRFYAKHGWEERPDAANLVLELSNAPRWKGRRYDQLRAAHYHDQLIQGIGQATKTVCWRQGWNLGRALSGGLPGTRWIYRLAGGLRQ